MAKSRDEMKSKHGPGATEQALRDDNKRLHSELKKLRKKQGKDQILIDEITSRVESIGKLPKIKQVAKIKPKSKTYRRPLSAVLNIADPHLEEVVDPIETEGLGEWNFDRWLRATWATVMSTIDIVEIMRAKHDVNELHINWLGDMITGEIHPDAYYTNHYFLPDALVYGPWYFSQAVRELSAHFNNVYNTCLAGNHGRMDIKTPAKKKVARNFDTAMYQNTAVLTKNLQNVEWRIPRSPKCVTEVNGWYFLLQHGDQVACHGGTSPYYGMSRQRSAEMSKRVGNKVKNVQERLEKGLLFDFDVRGHLHQFASIEERTLLCPSMMGPNEFSLSKSFSYSSPGSRLFFIDSEHGMAGDWNIHLSNLSKTHRFEKLPSWNGQVNYSATGL